MTNKANPAETSRLTKHAKLRILRDKVAKYLKSINLTKAGPVELTRLNELRHELKAITHSEANAAGKLISGAFTTIARRLNAEGAAKLASLCKQPAIKKPVVSKRATGKSKAFAAPPGKPSDLAAFMKGATDKVKPGRKTAPVVNKPMTLAMLEAQISIVERAAIIFRADPAQQFMGKDYPFRVGTSPTCPDSDIVSRVKKALQGTKFADVQFAIIRANALTFNLNVTQG